MIVQFDTDDIDTIVKLCRRYYQDEGHSSGGHLHIVLDDGNLEDDHVQYCLDEATTDNDATAIDIATRLLKLPRDVRVLVYHRYEEYSWE